METLKISFMAHSLLLGLQVIDPLPLITQEQKHGLKCQKIEQGKGYNMILITALGFKML